MTLDGLIYDMYNGFRVKNDKYNDYDKYNDSGGRIGLAAVRGVVFCFWCRSRLR